MRRRRWLPIVIGIETEVVDIIEAVAVSRRRRVLDMVQRRIHGCTSEILPGRRRVTRRARV